MTEPPPLVCVPPDKVSSLWPVAERFIREGHEAVDEPMPENMVEWLESGKGLLWLCLREGTVVAALTTSLVIKPSGLCCRMVSCGGEGFDYWRACERRIVEYARAEGCVKVTAEGRNGWARALPGYKVKRVHIEKVI